MKPGGFNSSRDVTSLASVWAGVPSRTTEVAPICFADFFRGQVCRVHSRYARVAAGNAAFVLAIHQRGAGRHGQFVKCALGGCKSPHLDPPSVHQLKARDCHEKNHEPDKDLRETT